jgi:hypothetical protein
LGWCGQGDAANTSACSARARSAIARSSLFSQPEKSELFMPREPMYVCTAPHQSSSLNCSPYRRLHVRRGRVCVVPRSRAVPRSAVPTPIVRLATNQSLPRRRTHAPPGTACLGHRWVGRKGGRAAHLELLDGHHRHLLRGGRRLLALCRLALRLLQHADDGAEVLLQTRHTGAVSLVFVQPWIRQAGSYREPQRAHRELSSTLSLSPSLSLSLCTPAWPP